MNASRTITGLVLLLIGVGMVLCFGPWMDTAFARSFLTLSKLLGLVVAATASFLSYEKHDPQDRQRRPWLFLAFGMLFAAGGQSVLAYHQILLKVATPFPSLGDPLFVFSSLLLVWALFDFCRLASRAGLPLGEPLVFWSPALIVFGLVAIAAYPMLEPLAVAQVPWEEKALNLYYPLISFVTLAPCMVALRISYKFRGGRLLSVWLPLALGFTCVLVSDVLFAYLTTVNAAALDALATFLYLPGYLLIARGTLFELELLRS